MVSAVSTTSDILKELASQVKTQKGLALTPNAIEAGPGPGIGLPKDLPNVFLADAAVRMAAQDLRRHAATLLAMADDLDRLYGESTATAVKAEPVDPRPILSGTGGAPIAPKPEPERDFDAELKAKQAKAQAEVFKPQVASTAATGWKCPDHGQFVVKTNRAERKYRECPVCDEFELLS